MEKKRKLLLSSRRILLSNQDFSVDNVPSSDTLARYAHKNWQRYSPIYFPKIFFNNTKRQTLSPTCTLDKAKYLIQEDRPSKALNLCNLKRKLEE